MELIKVDIIITAIGAQQKITTSNIGKVNAIEFINTGTSTVIVNQSIPIYPTGSWSPPAPNSGEMLVTTFDIYFNTTGIASPVNSCVVISKVIK